MPRAKITHTKAIKNTDKENQSDLVTSKEYLHTLSDLKRRIQVSQLKAATAVNRELVRLYWDIGKTIVEKQEAADWGTGIIEQLGKDLQTAFPGIEGFSRRNIFRMRAFYMAYQKVPQPVALIEDLPVFKIPWGHNALILEKIKDIDERLWYAKKTIEHGWSRSALEDWIKSNVYHREGKAVTNFSARLPEIQSRLAQETLKDPYCFDFLGLGDDHREQELEQGLIDHIQKTLIELGQGFAFVGRQVHLQVGDTDFYIDLLFYHMKLRSYVVVELKSTPFKPEYAGKLNFYLSAVDDLMRHQEDRPTIGMLLCKTKNNFVVEYALRDIQKPIGVAGYETMLMEKLPNELKGTLPTVAEIEAELEKME